MTFNDMRDQLTLATRTMPLRKGLYQPFLGIIDAMTNDERVFPQMIDSNRRKRIAAGAGVSIAVVEDFISDFFKMREMQDQQRELARRLFGNQPNASF